MKILRSYGLLNEAQNEELETDFCLSPRFKKLGNIEAIGICFLEVKAVSGHCKINNILERNATFGSIFK